MNILVLSDLHIDTCDNFATFQWEEMDLIMQIEGIRDIYSIDKVIFNGDVFELLKYTFEDINHNGAFRLSYGFEYSALMETSNENYSFQFNEFDLYDWFLRLGVLSNANKLYFHDKIPTWNNFVNHPSYDNFWQVHALENAMKQPTVPNLNVAGWWDQEDFYGPMRTYENLEQSDPKHLNYVVVGPWNHGGWAHGPGDSLGEIPFGSNTGQYFRQEVEAPWFAYWLHDKGTLPLKEALLFQTGSDAWTRFDSWPPKEAQKENLYFGGHGKCPLTLPQRRAPRRLIVCERSRASRAVSSSAGGHDLSE